MLIKYTINFYPNKSKAKEDGNAPLRCYLRWCNISLIINTGYNVNINGWNSETQRCKKNSYHDKQNISATYLNKEINTIEEVISGCFEHFEQLEQVPSKDQLKELIDIRTGKIKPKEDKDNFLVVFDAYIAKNENNEKWSYNTSRRVKVVRNQIKQFDKNCKLSDFDSNMIDRLLSFFFKIGNNNDTILQKLKVIKAVLGYAISQKIIDKSSFLGTKVELKTAKKNIVFLTWEELMRIYNYDFSNTPHLDNVRDVFCFCCFTSLRYSDVANLKHSNIVDNAINITTIKTADTLSIELNKFSKSILDKYEGQVFKKGRVLPVISNQKMNDYLKEIAKICEIDTPITITTFKGTKRVETIVPKYELISSHAGRRTFISNAIMLGIPPEIVMKWSGHSDYKAMKPYIEIANEAKKKAMSLFDNL